MASPDTYGGGGGPGPGAWVSFFVGMRRAAHVVRGPGPLATAALRRAGYTVKSDRGKAKYYDPSGKRIGRHAARNVGRIYAGKAPVGSGKSWAKASVAAWRILNPFPTATAAPPPTRWPAPPPINTRPQPLPPGSRNPYNPNTWPVPAPRNPPPPPPRAPPRVSLPDAMPPPVGLPGKYSATWQAVVAYAIIYALPYLFRFAGETWAHYMKRWRDRQREHERERQRQEHRRTPGGPGHKPWALPGQDAPWIGRLPEGGGILVDDGEDEMGRGDPFPPGGPPAPQVIIIHVPPQVASPNPSTGPAQTPSAPPTPAPAPAPAPKKPLWQQLLEQYGSAPFTQKGKRPIRVINYRDPLTPSYSTGVDSAPMAFGDYAAWSPNSTGTDACTCPKKKGKKRKKRTVCYRGTYTETASGLTKRKREKVPCK